MIRINLMAVDRERVKKQSKSQTVQQVTIGCVLILVAAGALVGWWYWSLKGASVRLDQQIAEARTETVRLQALILQSQELEKRRAQLQQRVTLIEVLRKSQSGPVHLLDQISRSLPDTMWITAMKQAGADVVIDGRCSTLTALSDFVANLEASPVFERPVEIVDSVVESATPTTAEVIRFSVHAKLIAAGT